MIQKSVSPEDISSAVELWWEYYDRKKNLSESGLGGITPRLISDYELGRTVKYSLVDIIAPELDGLGRLVNAQNPHVYVEGTRGHDVVVPFQEIYEGIFAEKYPFTSDPKNKFLSYLRTHNIRPDRFLLYVYSINDFDKPTNPFYKDNTVVDVLFMNLDNRQSVAYILEGGWDNVDLLRPIRSYLPNIYYHLYPYIQDSPRFNLYMKIRDIMLGSINHPFRWSNRKPTQIRPITEEELKIVGDSFRNAIHRISSD